MVEVGAMVKIPTKDLKGNFKDLITELTVNNPKAKTGAFFGGKFTQSKEPSKLHFFALNEAEKAILAPRNIDLTKYILPEALKTIKYNLNEGRPIGVGRGKDFKLRPSQEKFFNEQFEPCYIRTLNNNSNIYIYNNSNIYNNINKQNKINTNLDILIDAECGSGKTIMSLYISSLYQVSTLVCVTTKKIGKQFLDSCKALFPTWTVGWYDPKEKFDITIATYSLLSNFTEHQLDDYGHIIMDEYHRTGADTYQDILSRCSAKYRTTVTATFRRKDGLHKILQYHVGNVLHMDRTSQKAEIYMVDTECTIDEIYFRNVDKYQTKPPQKDDLRLSPSKRVKLDRLEPYTEIAVKHLKTRKELARGLVKDTNTDTTTIISASDNKTEIVFDNFSHTYHKLGTLSVATIDSEITTIAKRNDLVYSILREVKREGRKTLVLSKRKELLFHMYFYLMRRGYKVGVVISDKSQDYRQFCDRIKVDHKTYSDYVFSECDVILGIDKLAEEGLDIPSFDTLIYMHPISDIEQSIGRITREYENKQVPRAYFLVDRVSCYSKTWEKKGGARDMFINLGHRILNYNKL